MKYLTTQGEREKERERESEKSRSDSENPMIETMNFFLNGSVRDSYTNYYTFLLMLCLHCLTFKFSTGVSGDTA